MPTILSKGKKNILNHIFHEKANIKVDTLIKLEHKSLEKLRKSKWMLGMAKIDRARFIYCCNLKHFKHSGW